MVVRGEPPIIPFGTILSNLCFEIKVVLEPTNCERAELFAIHFTVVLQSHTDRLNPLHDNTVEDLLISPLQLSLPPKALSPHEIQNVISKFPKKKTPGYDLITAEVLQQLHEKAILFLTYIHIIRFHAPQRNHSF